MTPVVYLDMDGVLVNFVQGALDHFNSDHPFEDITWDFPKDVFGYPDAYDPAFWAHFANEEFWFNLKWTPEGQGLLKHTEEMVGQENIGLLTTPMDIAGCIEGKRQWIKKHLPEYSKQLIVTPAKYLLAGPKKILVDDHDPNCSKFMKSPKGLPTGGSSVLIPRPWNSAKPRTVGKGGFDLNSITSELRWTIRQTV